MILGLELFGSFLAGIAACIVLLAKYGLRLGQWYMRRAMKGMMPPPKSPAP